MVEDARNRYPSVDFYRYEYDVDDRSNSKLKKGWGVERDSCDLLFRQRRAGNSPAARHHDPRRAGQLLETHITLSRNTKD